jgi:phosphoglycerol transferase
VVAILVVGTSGLYYAFFTLMFLAFAGAVASIGQLRWFPVQAVACSAVLIFLLLMFSGYGLDLPLVLSGRYAQPHREALEQLLYGVDLRSMATRFDWIKKVAEAITQSAAAVPSPPDREGFGEWPALPLTLALMIAPLAAAACQLRLRGGDAQGPVSVNLRLIGFCSVCIIFALLFGARGGIGFLFNLLVSPEIRAGSRLMPFLNFAAVVMLCAVGELFGAVKRPTLRYFSASAAKLDGFAFTSARICSASAWDATRMCAACTCTYVLR